MREVSPSTVRVEGRELADLQRVAHEAFEQRLLLRFSRQARVDRIARRRQQQPCVPRCPRRGGLTQCQRERRGVGGKLGTVARVDSFEGVGLGGT